MSKASKLKRWFQNKRVILFLFIVPSIINILLTIISNFGQLNRYFELTTNFKFQYLIISICAVILFLFLRKRIWLVVNLFCVLINLYAILPWYLPQYKVEAKSSEQRLRLFLSNVRISNQQYAKVIDLVKEEKPDIAVFLEIDESWSKQLKALQTTLPFSFERQRTLGTRIIIYSKFTLKNPNIIDFGNQKINSLTANITFENQVISLIATHLSTPKTATSFQQRNRHLEAMGYYVARVKNPVVVLGDLNTTMWSPYYQSFIQTSKLYNARRGFGILPTWPTYLPLLYIPIDHCLLTSDIKVKNIRVGKNIGSDHLPLITDIAIRYDSGG